MNTLRLIRWRGERQIPSEELVVGDIVTLFVGDIVPADCKLLESRDLRIAHGGG
ncbi:P-type ATPase, partial [Bifidobacterium longum]